MSPPIDPPMPPPRHPISPRSTPHVAAIDSARSTTKSGSPAASSTQESDSDPSRVECATPSRDGALADIDLLSYISRVRFEWDPKKAAANLKKHEVSFGEAQTAFDDELGAYYPDSLHADRFILIGFSHRHRLLYVVHAEVAADVIRIISARKATRHEKAHYEED